MVIQMSCIEVIKKLERDISVLQLKLSETLGKSY